MRELRTSLALQE